MECSQFNRIDFLRSVHDLAALETMIVGRKTCDLASRCDAKSARQTRDCMRERNRKRALTDANARGSMAARIALDGGHLIVQVYATQRSIWFFSGFVCRAHSFAVQSAVRTKQNNKYIVTTKALKSHSGIGAATKNVRHDLLVIVWSRTRRTKRYKSTGGAIWPLIRQTRIHSSSRRPNTINQPALQMHRLSAA